MSTMLMKSTKGFTLVEVIVVLAIIAVISGLSIVGISTLQRSSRDANRLKTLENIKAEISRIQSQTGRVPSENDFTWGTERITIATSAGTKVVDAKGIATPKNGSANICSPTAESDTSGTVYCYRVERDGYILGADKEAGIIDVGTSNTKFESLRTNN